MDLKTVPGAISHFRQTPWCAALLDDATVTHKFVASLSPVNDFFNKTLRSPEALRCSLVLAREDDTGPPSSAAFANTTAITHSRPIRELRALLDLGDGVQGHTHACHGGFLAAAMDEITGTLLMLNRRQGTAVYTAYMNVRYKKPVRTPGIVLVRANYKKTEDKKIWVVAAVEDEYQSICAQAESLFIQVKTERL